MVSSGLFREDLFYRLKTITLHLPPLRERREDLRPLTLAYLDRLAANINASPKGFDAEFLRTLEGYRWPGNVRELFHTLEQAVVAAGANQTLFPMHLPKELRIQVTRTKVRASSGAPSGGAVAGDQGEPLPLEGGAHRELTGQHLPSLKDFKQQMEKLYLETMVRRNGGDIQDMVRLSGLSRSHFYAMLKKHGIPF